MSSLTSLSMTTSKTEAKQLCCHCGLQPYNLICTCGDKFDYDCIHHHVEEIGLEFQSYHNDVSQQMVKIDGLQEDNNTDALETIIDNWKHKRMGDINDIAARAMNQVQERKDALTTIKSFQESFDTLSENTQRIVHENLDSIMDLHRQIRDAFQGIEKMPPLMQDDISLNASLQLKLNPLAISSHALSFNSNHQDSTTNEIAPTIEIEPTTELEPTIELEPTHEIESTRSSPTTPIILNGNVLINTEPAIALTNTANMNGTAHESTTSDEFEAGQTRHIQRTNPILVSANNDKYAGTICCHNNQLIYNDYDKTARSCRLTYIPDVTQPTTRRNIDWNQPDRTVSGVDDDWIQDIIYSDKLAAYLILSRSRLRQLNNNTNDLEEFHTFENRSMKRLSCSSKYIYLTSTHDGDEIILMNYDKEEQLRKTFRDIIPTRINRGAGPLVGEISDLAVGARDQVIIGYRLERRHEVGVCLFNVTNEGKEWSCIKQLLLNECWHDNLSYTPRIDWCEELNVFILIEHMTGHLIMIDQEGQVEGECRFMQAENRRESPINLTISTNDWLCVRYESSISIHKINTRSS